MVQAHQESWAMKLHPQAHPLPPPNPQYAVSVYMYQLVYKAMLALLLREKDEREGELSLTEE